MANKTFQLAEAFITVLDGAQYTNNEPVSSSHNLPIVVVSDWDNVKALDKTEIIASALTFGFTPID
jgi:hypothetical protein